MRRLLRPICKVTVNGMSFKAGIYDHYKGGRYLGILVAETHNHNGDRDVIYYSLDREDFRTRPYERDSRNEDSWTDLVALPDGSDVLPGPTSTRKRFELVREYLPIELPLLLANLLLAKQNLETRIEVIEAEAKDAAAT